MVLLEYNTRLFFTCTYEYFARMNDSTHQSRLKQLIAKGKEQGYLTYSEVNDHLPEDISDPDQVEEIIQMINDMDIQVF